MEFIIWLVEDIPNNPISQFLTICIMFYLLVRISQRNEVRDAIQAGVYTDDFKPTPFWRMIYRRVILAQGPRDFDDNQEDELPDPPPPDPPHPQTLSPDDTWFGVLSRHPAHTLIVGPTRSGKSTAAMALLVQRVRRGDQVVILDPHAAPGNWGGLSVIGAGQDYAAIEHAMQQLLAEMKQRFLDRAQGKPAPPPITIFVDEWPSIKGECPTGKTFFMRMSRESAKIQMRLVILSQSSQVKSLGVEGEGETRENFWKLLLGPFAIEAKPQSRTYSYPAVLDVGIGMIVVDTSFLPSIAAIRLDSSALYPLASPVDGDLPDGVSSLPLLTLDHMKVAVWMASEPNISQREVATRLWGNGDGNYNQRARELMQVVRSTIGSMGTGSSSSSSSRECG